MLLAMYQATTVYFFIQNVLLVMSYACDTSIQRYLRFVRWRRICNERKERDPFFYAQMQLQSAGGMGQLAPTDWLQPKFEAADSLAKLRPVLRNRLKAFHHNSNYSGHVILNG